MRLEFSTQEEFAAIVRDLPQPDAAAEDAARRRDAELTKPPGALGRLEEIAVWYAGWRGRERPSLDSPQIAVFAGNHGVAAKGVSAFPAEVTAQMAANFRSGGAAINQLADLAGARIDVRELSLDSPTGDISEGPAMDAPGFTEALRVGWDTVDPQADMLVVGEMGIGNTTCAAAIGMALFGGAAQDWTGPGTGVVGAALERKAQTVAQAVEVNGAVGAGGLEVLRRLGGRELAAMAGAIARARIERIPVALDGFICCAAAACLAAESPGALDHAVAGHASEEPAHPRMLERIGKEPLLRLGLRLGEGTGGAIAIQIIRAALACHSGMATFEEAGVAEKDG